MVKQCRCSKGQPHGYNCSSDKEKKRKPTQNKELKCYQCGEIRHIHPNCPNHKRCSKNNHANIAMSNTNNNETILATVEQCKATTNEEHTWYLNSGAMCHITCNQDWLHNYINLTSESHNLILSNNFKCHIHGYSTLHTTTHVDGGKWKVMFQKVLYTPELAKNLLSTAHITSKGCQLTINTQGCCIYNQQGCTILHTKAQGNMLIVPLKPNAPVHQVNTIQQLPTLNELHHHFSHAREKQLRATLKSLSIEAADSPLCTCLVCKKGKQTCKPIQSGPTPQATSLLKCVHSDVCGPFPIPTQDGKHFFISFINNHSRCQKLQSDQGGEYTGSEFQRFLHKQGIIHKKVAPHTPEHNRVAKQFNHTIINMVQCMLFNSSLPKSFWGEALTTAVIINNQLTTITNQGHPPMSTWDNNKQLTLRKIHHFSCPVSALTPSGNQDKLKSRMHKGVYLSPARNNSTHHHVLVNSQVLESREVSFNNNPIDAPVANPNLNDLLEIPGLHIEEHTFSRQGSHINHRPNNNNDHNTSSTNDVPDQGRSLLQMHTQLAQDTTQTHPTGEEEEEDMVNEPIPK